MHFEFAVAQAARRACRRFLWAQWSYPRLYEYRYPSLDALDDIFASAFYFWNIASVEPPEGGPGWGTGWSPKTEQNSLQNGKKIRQILKILPEELDSK